MAAGVDQAYWSFWAGDREKRAAEAAKAAAREVGGMGVFLR